ncbi:flavoprotein [Paucilactobacillus oligofermentans DSM 15707 = LMG 22743]|uniref:Flavoprotein n=2 Tax=Paucilactobacillus oligofermentans TaxID=293371 RepID=A0A0R1RCD8_9LACO|nr:flavoprotein [Paucilactobacillus oligofermentans DSM 15707 = LMG 22743]
MLLEFMVKKYKNLVEIELVDISELPVFTQDNDLSDSVAIQNVYQKVFSADGVILATPEHNHTVPAAMKNMIEWLSYKLHPFTGKPVWIVGASYYDQGSSRAQLHLKQILESPGVNAFVMPSNEFLLSNAKSAFDEDGNLKDTRTIKFLDSIIEKFLHYVKVIDLLDTPDPRTSEDEDLDAKNPVNTTIENVNMKSDEWVENASLKVHAVDGSTYVKLDRGILTVNQINYFLNSMPMELTYADDNNQFIYYNHNVPDSKMLAARVPRQVGSPLSQVHPERAFNHVKKVIHALRNGTELVGMPVSGNNNDIHVMHYYKAMRDENGRYRGVNEWVLDIMPIIKYYLSVTGQKLVKDEQVDKISPIFGLDVITGASVKNNESTDSFKSASKHENDETKNNSITESEIGIEIGKLLNSGGNIATEGVQPEGVKRSNQQLSKEVNVENSSDNDVDVVSGASEN